MVIDWNDAIDLPQPIKMQETMPTILATINELLLSMKKCDDEIIQINNKMVGRMQPPKWLKGLLSKL